MIDTILIPKERLGILIGKDGEIKEEIERRTNTKIAINEEIRIEGEALGVMDAKDIIKAIGRGFAPEKAFLLLDENNTLCVISLPDDRKELKRIKARIIGTNGRCKNNIQRLTETFISIYGKTISIIGTYENVESAREAIEKLIRGSPHKNVYRSLEKK